jgi:DNA-binding CsgD family transcriptional regulator
MRVTVSLSDRPTDDDWRHSAACRQMDPRDFDEGGTIAAREACNDQCVVKAECLADCFRAKPYDIYRAGRYWPDVTGSRGAAKVERLTVREERIERWQEWARLRELGLSLPQIARATGHHHATVLHALRKMGVA